MARQGLEQLSQLEQELELELESSDDTELELDEEREAPSTEAEIEDAEFESMLEEERERTFGDRLADLASREYEDERELELAIGEVLDDMEREYFFKRIGKFISKRGKDLLKRGMSVARKLPAVKVLQGVTRLARGNMKGLLGSLIQAGLAGAIPGGAFLGPLLKSLTSGGAGAGGLGGLLASASGGASRGGLAGLLGSAASGLPMAGLEAETAEDDTERFERLAEIAETAYRELASRLTENADDPIEASRIAHGAFEAALRQHVGGAPGPKSKDTRHIVLRPGQRLVVSTRR